MERPNILGKTRDTITKFKPGSVFSASDFSDISDSAKIGVTLSRLEKEGLIKKNITWHLCISGIQFFSWGMYRTGS